MLANVYPHLAVGQLDDDAPGVADTAAKVDVFEGCGVAVAAFGKGGLGSGRGNNGVGPIEHHNEGLAFHLGLVGCRLLEVDHHAGAVPGLHHIGRTQIALVHFGGVAAYVVDHTWKVQRNPGGRLDGEPGGYGRQRFAGFNANDFYAALDAPGQRLNRILSLGPNSGQRHGGEDGASEHRALPCSDFLGHVGLDHLDASSCSCSAAGRSVHSPAESCTISRSVTSVSVILFTRP